MDDPPDWLAQVLTERKPLLFHGTLEAFHGRLVASGWEGLRWTASSAAVAQSYCAVSGMSQLVTMPAHRSRERFLPSDEVEWGILDEMGVRRDSVDIERDERGRLLSYAVPDGHPTYSDVRRHVETVLGYRFENDCAWVSVSGDRAKPSGWRKSGWLYILERPDDLRLVDLRRETDEGLTGRQWMRTDRFRELLDSGDCDGVVVSDVHHSSGFGHFEHVSYGLFDRTLERLRWHRIPCVHHDPQDSFGKAGATTPEMAKLVARLARHATPS